MADPKAKDFVCVGQFSAPHGLKGAIRLKSFTEAPESIKRFRAFFAGDQFSPVKIRFSNPAKDGFLVTIQGITTPEDAGRFKGQQVFVARADFQPLEGDEFYLTDLEGLEVLDLKGAKVGVAEKVFEFGAGPVLEISLLKPVKDYGATLLLPLKGNAITKIDVKGGVLTVDLETWLKGDEE